MSNDARIAAAGDAALPPRRPVWPWLVAAAAPIAGMALLAISLLLARVGDAVQEDASRSEDSGPMGLDGNDEELVALYRKAGSDAAADEAAIGRLLERIDSDGPFLSRRRAVAILDTVYPGWERSAAAQQKVAEICTRLEARTGRSDEGAFELLGYIGSRQAIGPLIHALEKDYDVAFPAWQTLRRIHPDWPRSEEAKQTAPFLRDTLARRSTSWCKQAAMAVLAGLHDRQAIGPLLNAYLDNGHDEFGCEILRALAVIDPDWQRSEQAKATAARCVATLAESGRDVDDRRRLAAIVALRCVGDASAAPGLIEYMFTDKGREQRSDCLTALYQIAPDWRQSPAARKAAAAAAALLKSPENYRREQALEALRILADLATVEPLLDAYLSPDWGNAFQVEYVLNELDDRWRRGAAVQARFPKLVEMLASPSARLRQRVAELLGDAGDSRAVDPLLKCLADEDWAVRGEAAESLGKLCDRPILPLILLTAHKDKDVREAAEEALRRVSATWYGSAEAKAAVPELVKLLKSPDVSVRLGVVNTLSAIGTQPAMDGLKEATKDSDPRVQAAAKQWLDLLQR